MNKKIVKRIYNIVVILLLAGAACWCLSHFVHGSGVEYTDDALVCRHITPINTRVQDFIKEIRFSDFQHVKKGDKVLMVTNPAPLVVLMSRLKKKAVYFKRGDEAKVEQLAANSLEADELPKSDANGVVRIDMLLSSDTAFAAAQVFSCTDYMYNPVGDIHIYTGSDAKLFITKIRQITR